MYEKIILPDIINTEDGVLGVKVGTDLFGFPIDRIEDTHIFLKKDS